MSRYTRQESFTEISQSIISVKAIRDMDFRKPQSHVFQLYNKTSLRPSETTPLPGQTGCIDKSLCATTASLFFIGRCRPRCPAATMIRSPPEAPIPAQKLACPSRGARRHRNGAEERFRAVDVTQQEALSNLSSQISSLMRQLGKNIAGLMAAFRAILAVSHHVKFFHFRVTEDFLAEFETLSLKHHTSGAGFLRVGICHWLACVNPRALHRL